LNDQPPPPQQPAPKVEDYARKDAIPVPAILQEDVRRNYPDAIICGDIKELQEAFPLSNLGPFLPEDKA
jgi:hypothetical protein